METSQRMRESIYPGSFIGCLEGRGVQPRAMTELSSSNGMARDRPLALRCKAVLRTESTTQVTVKGAGARVRARIWLVHTPPLIHFQVALETPPSQDDIDIVLFLWDPLDVLLDVLFEE